MRDKLENLVIGYLVIMLILFVCIFIMMVMPGNIIGAAVFMIAVFFYPAMMIGKNLKKIEQAIRRNEW